MWPRRPQRSMNCVLRPTLTTVIPGDAGAARDPAGYPVTRRSLPQTNVVKTAFTTAAGVVRLTDWLHVGARQAMCRRLEGISGEVEMELVCDPRPNFGEDGPIAWRQRL